MVKAIQAAEDGGLNIPEERRLMLCLSALLHEADDHKYFGEGSANAAVIVKKVLGEEAVQMCQDVEEAISYVSASVNGNSVPPKAVSDPTWLWPRYCDRIEAIGTKGAVRCLQYNQEVGATLQSETTPRPVDAADVWNHVVEERWLKYQNGGSSASMMDHFYDKLLHIAVFKKEVVKNTYLEDQASQRVEPLVRICVEYGKTGEAPVALIKSFA